MSSRTRFIIVLVAALVGVVVTLSLGRWQLSRAAQKQTIAAQIDARKAEPALGTAALASAVRGAASASHPGGSAALLAELHYRRAELRGTWLAQHTVYLDNRQMDNQHVRAQPGFFVVTPLKLAGSDAVLPVQRGWVPRDGRDRTRLPAIATPTGEVAITARITPPPARLYAFSGADSGSIRQNLDLESFSREVGVPLPALSLQQQQDAAHDGDGLLRDWPQVASGVHKHYGYAAQWFGLAALIAGLYVWFQLLRPRIKQR
jgi:surfeit locus 1 family protein